MIMKKIVNYKTIGTLSLAALLSISSCTEDFDAMNTNPNSPTSIGAQYLLPYWH